MKKVLLGLLVFLIVLSGVFYQQIHDTVKFYRFQQEHPDIIVRSALTWEQIPFTSADHAGRASDSLTFGSLQLPIPFGMTKKVGADAAIAVGYTEIITVTRSSAAAEFFRMFNFTDDERLAACAFLSKTSGRGACTTNYDLHRAFLELNRTDIHAFSPIAEKQLYNRLMTLRTNTLPGFTVSGFETNNLRGFIFTIDTDTFTVDLFDSADQQYRLEFDGLEQSDVAYVLSNATVKAKDIIVSLSGLKSK